MALLVVGYPTLSKKHTQWIQAIRQSHDPQFSLVGPHFTFVFAVSTVPDAEFIIHAHQILKGTRQIPFVLRCAIVVKDSFSDNAYVFLVPDKGFSAFIKLHDALYTKRLAGELRQAVPFIPHITVGGHADLHECKRLADELNVQNFQVRGSVTALDIVRHANGAITTLEQVPLN